MYVSTYRGVEMRVYELLSAEQRDEDQTKLVYEDPLKDT